VKLDAFSDEESAEYYSVKTRGTYIEDPFCNEVLRLRSVSSNSDCTLP